MEAEEYTVTDKLWREYLDQEEGKIDYVRLIQFILDKYKDFTKQGILKNVHLEMFCDYLFEIGLLNQTERGFNEIVNDFINQEHKQDES